MPKSQRITRTNRYAPYVRAAARVGGSLLRDAAGRAAKSWSQRRNKHKATTRRLNQSIMPVGNGSSQSFFSKTYKCKLAKRILKNLAPVRVTVQTSAETLRTSAFGKQSSTAVWQFPCSQISNYFTNLVDSSGSQTQSMLLRSIEQEYLISNASSANAFVKIYEVTARNDFYTASTSPVLAQSIARPDGAFDQGVYDINTGMDATTFGITPFQSQLFTQMYRIDKIHHIELGAGRSHKHLSRFSPNTVVHEPRTSRNTILERVTRGILIVAYGSPVNDSVTNTLVSMSKVALNIVRKETAKIQFLDPQGAVYYNQQTLGAVSTARHVDEGGAVQTEVES